MKINGDLMMILGITALLSVLLVAILLLWPHKAHGQQRTVYGADGRAAYRTTQDSQGTVVIYDAVSGRKVGSIGTARHGQAGHGTERRR